MNRRLVIVLLLLTACIIVILNETRVVAPLVPIVAKPAPAVPDVPAPTPVVQPAPVPATPETSAPRPPEQEIQLVSFSIENFRKSLGSNPVGANAEITRSLLGDNDKKLATGLPEGVKQNAEGEMVDHWGTPYFFHQQSATEMEIRSAGPDRKLWTDDDLIAK